MQALVLNAITLWTVPAVVFSSDGYDYYGPPQNGGDIDEHEPEPSETLPILRTSAPRMDDGACKGGTCCMCRQAQTLATCYGPKVKVKAKDVNFLNMVNAKRERLESWKSNLCCRWVTKENQKDKIKRGYQSAVCYGYHLDELPCTTGHDGKPVYRKTGFPRVLDLAGNGWKVIKEGFDSLREAAKKTFTGANIAKVYNSGKEALKELFTTKAGWWKIFQIGVGLTITAVSLFCPVCTVGAAIAAAAWAVVKNCVDAIANYQAKDEDGNRKFSNGLIVGNFLFGIVGGASQILTGFAIGPEIIADIFALAPNAWMGLTETCRLVAKSTNGATDENDEKMRNIQLNPEDMADFSESFKDLQGMDEVKKHFDEQKEAKKPQGIDCASFMDKAKETDAYKAKRTSDVQSKCTW